MSIWTHVNASFRLDAIGGYAETELNNIFGKSVLWEGDGTGNWDDYDKHPEQYLPCGSEGSLQISIWNNPHKSELCCCLVNVFGDLRDYEDEDPIKEWFEKVCRNKKLCIRQAVCEVNVSWMTHKVYVLGVNDNIEELVCKTEV